MFELIKADLHRKTNGFGTRPEDQTFFRKRITPFLEFGTFATIVYRFGYWAYTVKIPVIRQLLIAAYLFIDAFCMMVTGIKISRETKVGPGLIIHNFSGIHILCHEIGHSCTVNQGVSIANIRGVGRATIGNNCYFGAGCKVLGSVTMGDNVVVSANSLVVSDVPSNCTVMGVPARIISREASSPYLKTSITALNAKANAAKAAPTDPAPAETTAR
ncbi:MAG: DapH/DapD/GlmU-related protein [Chthoniobacterales bacterium]